MLISTLVAVASAAPAATESQGRRGKMDGEMDGKTDDKMGNRMGIKMDDKMGDKMDGKMDRGEYNNFAFKNEELQYLNAINELDLQVFVKLAVLNDLDISDFKPVFVRDELDINALLQLQQVVLLQQLAVAGLFDDFDLAIIKIKPLDLGLFSDVGRFDVASLINDSIRPHLQAAIQKTKVKAIFDSDDESKE
ncbi:hypothetical protein DL771_012312 [Monosporascus sp. 5C6A]|nr:hypothetical protein DL771_012312 [Monosporascus sp. 5C6A]